MQAIQQQVVPIVYIGKKPYKTDNINHTKTVWNGTDDVQPYPLDKAAALLRHPDVWKLGKAEQLAGGATVVDGAGAVRQAEQGQPKDKTKSQESFDTDTGATFTDASKEGPAAPTARNARSLE